MISYIAEIKITEWHKLEEFSTKGEAVIFILHDRHKRQKKVNNPVSYRISRKEIIPVWQEDEFLQDGKWVIKNSL